jgi:hypothetical protein
VRPGSAKRNYVTWKRAHSNKIGVVDCTVTGTGVSFVVQRHRAIFLSTCCPGYSGRENPKQQRLASSICTRGRCQPLASNRNPRETVTMAASRLRQCSRSLRKTTEVSAANTIPAYGRLSVNRGYKRNVRTPIPTAGWAQKFPSACGQACLDRRGYHPRFAGCWGSRLPRDRRSGMDRRTAQCIYDPGRHGAGQFPPLRTGKALCLTLCTPYRYHSCAHDRHTVCAASCTAFILRKARTVPDGRSLRLQGV